jgi:soluble lytic murein transglycosylase-like protein
MIIQSRIIRGLAAAILSLPPLHFVSRAVVSTEDKVLFEAQTLLAATQHELSTAWGYVPASALNSSPNGSQGPNSLLQPAPQNMKQLAQQIARKYAINPYLFHALIQIESAWNPGAVSSAGALGLGQVMPMHTKAGGICFRANLLDPFENLDCAARIFKSALETHVGDSYLALREYNGGVYCARTKRCPESEDYT